MFQHVKKILFFSHLFFIALVANVNSETTDIKEILEIIQKDLRTLERAVYSESFSQNSKTTS